MHMCQAVKANVHYLSPSYKFLDHVDHGSAWHPGQGALFEVTTPAHWFNFKLEVAADMAVAMKTCIGVLASREILPSHR